MIALATHGGDELPPDPRESIETWLNSPDRTDGPDKQLRLALGV